MSASDGARQLTFVLPYLADAITKQVGWQLVFTVGMATVSQQPLLVLSPILAETMARSGYSKRDVQEYLFKRARIVARKFEQYIGKYTHFIPDNRTQVDLANIGKAPRIFAESDDPDRMEPIVGAPGDFLIAVSGDPLRTNAYVATERLCARRKLSNEAREPASRRAASGNFS
jgi:hypothetical protein